MTDSVDPDQTAPIGAVCSVSTLFASIHKFASNVRQLFAADDIFRRILFLGALRVKKALTYTCSYDVCCVKIFVSPHHNCEKMKLK